MTRKGRLVILTGPSCAGKSPLAKALKIFYPDLYKNLQPMVLYNSRAARPGEADGVDYHFRSREFIEKLRENDQYVLIEVRGDLTALDLKALDEGLQKGDMFFEGNPFVGHILQTHPSLQSVERLSAFMSPLSKEEIRYLQTAEPKVNLEEFVTDVMRRKLLRRTRKQKGELSLKDLENIEKRCGSAYTEMKQAHNFQCVIPNHDGEDSENWNAFYHPVGDARKALNTFASLLKGEKPMGIEHWENSLI